MIYSLSDAGGPFWSTHSPHKATLWQQVVQRDVQLLQDGENDLGTFSVAISTSGGESDKTGLIAAPFLSQLSSAFCYCLP